ncbi:MAG TPA: zinc ribbon domain-containing protein, partial [Rubrivivax sp.]|nr:zinc ribbon domain-containing protein [Rubrivivax sp.]
FNADPNLLLQEVDRELQSRWVHGIPNRRYTWQAPQIDPSREAGNFTLVALEETQPMPPQAVRRMDWSTCLAFPRFYSLAALDALGVALTLAGAWLWLRLGSQLLQPGSPGSWSTGLIGLTLIIVGGYGLRVAHLLWGRLDFESTLTWLDCSGSYARAQVGLGSQWTDRVRSERTVVNVESMTLRAWVVRARSVIFDYRAQTIGSRTLVGMAGDIDAARAWTQQVRQFAQAQSALIVPGGNEDARRLQQLGAANQLAGTPVATSAPSRLGAGAAAPPPHPLTAASPDVRQCGACGASLAAGAQFCSRCGAPVVGAPRGGDLDLSV